MQVNTLVQDLVRLHHAAIVNPARRKVVSSSATPHVALCEAVKSFSPLTTEGGEIFAQLASSMFVPELVDMLVSPVDESISFEIIRLLVDFSDPDSFEGEQRSNALLLINKLLDCDLLNALITHYFHVAEVFQILDQLCEIYPTAVPDHVAERTDLLEKLINYFSNPVSPADDTALAKSELLDLLLHGSEIARTRIRLAQPNFVNDLLFPLCQLEIRDEEVLEHVLDALLRVLLDSKPCKLLCGTKGIACSLNLMRMHQAGLGCKLASALCLHCKENCQLFVDQGGLKILFPVLFASSSKNRKGNKHQKLLEGTETAESYALSLLSSLSLMLDFEHDVQGTRVFAKLCETGKFEHLLEIHTQFAKRVKDRVLELEEEEDEDEENDSEAEYLDLWDHGLKELELVDVILASGWKRAKEVKVQGLMLGEEAVQKEIQKVLVDAAERIVVLDETGAVDNESTLMIKSNLFNRAV